MYFSSLGGNYLKAQRLNNTTKLRCEHYQREITKKHIHSLAIINKNIRDMEDFLKDIKSNTGYCTDVQEFSSIYQSKFSTKPSPVDLNQTRECCKSPDIKTPALPEPQVFNREILNLGQRVRTEKFGVDQVDKVAQLRDGRNERGFVSEAGSSFPAKNAIRTGKGSGHERGRRSHERNTKAAQWLVRDENLMETDKKDSGSIAKNSETEQNSDQLQKETKPSQSNLFLQLGKNILSSEQGVQNANIRLQEGKAYKPTYQPAEPRRAWTDRPRRNRDPAISISKVGGATNRIQTAPAKASRIRLASASEGKLNITERSPTANHQSSNDLKKLNIHVSLSKTERRRILQELICNNTVTPDRSFLEKERQVLLKDKISKFFESLYERTDTKRGTNDEDIFGDDEDLP